MRVGAARRWGGEMLGMTCAVGEGVKLSPTMLFALRHDVLQGSGLRHLRSRHHIILTDHV